jgi:hypothetical protein
MKPAAEGIPLNLNSVYTTNMQAILSNVQAILSNTQAILSNVQEILSNA